MPGERNGAIFLIAPSTSCGGWIRAPRSQHEPTIPTHFTFSKVTSETAERRPRERPGNRGLLSL